LQGCSFLNALLNWKKKSIEQNIIEIKSDTGSERYTAITLLSGKIAGRMNIIGIIKTNFLMTATIMELFAQPMAVNVAWHAICTPNRPIIDI